MTTRSAPLSESQVLWVVGGGSGVGRSTAVSAAAQGYRVAVSGRRPDALEETAQLVRAVGGTDCLIVPLDVGDPDSVSTAQSRVAAQLGTVTSLVYAAGVNDPQRFWSDQSMTRFEEIVQINLISAARLTDAVLPGMRSAGAGTIVFISSYAGWNFQPGAGVAYSASKTAIGTLCKTINAQEGERGIRACNLCPGDIDTDFLSMRPSVPDAAARLGMLKPDDVAAAVQFVLDAPPAVRIDELVISPIGMAV